jgi:hypothetical protein
MGGGCIDLDCLEVEVVILLSFGVVGWVDGKRYPVLQGYWLDREPTNVLEAGLLLFPSYN